MRPTSKLTRFLTNPLNIIRVIVFFAIGASSILILTKNYLLPSPFSPLFEIALIIVPIILLLYSYIVPLTNKNFNSFSLVVFLYYFSLILFFNTISSFPVIPSVLLLVVSLAAMSLFTETRSLSLFFIISNSLFILVYSRYFFTGKVNVTFLISFFTSELLIFVISKVRLERWTKAKRNEIFKSKVFENSPNAIFVLDQNGTIIESNSVACNIINCQNKNLTEKISFFDLDAFTSLYSIIKDILSQNKQIEAEKSLILNDKDNKSFHWDAKIRTFNIFSDLFILLTLSDTTKIRQFKKDLLYQSLHDDLTGLPNRHLIEDRLEFEIRQHPRSNTFFALLFLDIDQFRLINDRFGHQIGDLLLQKVAHRIEKAIRDYDTLSRISGDDFLIVLTNLSEEQEIIEICERIISTFSAPFHIQDQNIITSASIGIALFPQDGKDFGSLLKNSEIAMYLAKKSGQNLYKFFEQKMNEELIQQIEIKEDISKAIKRKEFEMEYQPKVDIKTGKMIGVEALIRWNHPKKGKIPPDKFIPVAEQSNLILDLDQYVLEQVFWQVYEWQKQNKNFHVSVNVSARQFNNIRFPEKITTLIRQTDVNPHYIDIEITESAMMKNSKRAIEISHKLKSEGISLSLDDFGKGYSSLAYVKNFPIDTLKIDKTFVDGINQTKEDEAIILAAIAMARALNINIVAEGVETKEQFHFLKKTDCNHIQGFFFSRPLSPKELSKIIDKDFLIP